MSSGEKGKNKSNLTHEERDLRKKKTKKRQGFIQLIFVIIFIVGSFGISKLLEFQKPDVKRSKGGDRQLFVEYQVAEMQDYQIKFDVTGNVSARSNIDVVPEVSGRVVAVNESFFDGGKFEAGEVLFEVDPQDYKLEIEKLSAEVARAKTLLDVEVAQSNSAKAEWKMLNPEKQIPDLVSRLPQMKEAKANLLSAKAALSNASLDLKRSKYSLSFAGSVLSSSIEVGDYLMAGQSYGSVYNAKNLEVRASLSDKQLQWLLSNQGSEIIISVKNGDGSEKEYQGILSRSATSLNQETRFATVAFAFKDYNPSLVPGLFATVKILGPKLEGVYVLPVSTLQRGDVVWRVDANETISPVIATVEYVGEEKVAISNLNAGDYIVTSKISGASKGMKVKAVNNGEGYNPEGSYNE